MDGTVFVLTELDRWMCLYRTHAPEGVAVVWVDPSRTFEDQASVMDGASAVISSGSVDILRVARLLPSLRLVQVNSAGTDGIDVGALNKMGIKVANGGGGNAVAVSEHAIALMLSSYRKLDRQFASVLAKQWRGDLFEEWSSFHELTGKTVGIVGLGRIGQEMAKRLRGFDCRLLYFDTAPRSRDLEKSLRVTRLSLDELLGASDVITLHVPHTEQTAGLIGVREFDLMKPTAVLINVSRGHVVDEAALIDALRTGKIAGAGLDVLQQEPADPGNPLLDMGNVTVTPHLASFAQEAIERSYAFAVQNAARVVNGLEPLSVVVPELGGPVL